MHIHSVLTMNHSSTAPAARVRIQPSDIPAVAGAFSGALGGAIANLIVSPVNLVTTRMQVNKEYKNVFDAFCKIYQEEGIAAFYEGATQSSLSVMISAFFYFYAYDMLRNGRLRQIAQRRKSGKAPATLGIAEELLIGSLAGMFCKFITSPLSNIVTRQQTAHLTEQSTHKQIPTSAIGILKDIYNEKGITGLWTGYKATIFLSVNPSLTYYFFQLLKAVFIPRKYRDNPSKFHLFFFPATAKTLATLLTYPLLLFKTRVQIKSTKGASEVSFKSLLTHNPYQGASGQVLKGFFSQGITMLTKDQISRFIIYLYFVFLKLSR